MEGLQKYWYRITPLHLILLPLSLLFGLLAAARRTLYRSGLLSGEKLPVPVIVIGNITVGGSGKTPLTLWLAQQLFNSGRHPGITSRGSVHGQPSPASPLPVNSSSNPEQTGDEPVLMAQRELCPVWVGRDRVATGRALLQAHPECDVLLSDDGLQHYRLQRDVEIVVVDGTRRFGNGLLLPAGPLREPPSRIRTVDAVVVNGGSASPGEFGMQLHGTTFHNLLNPQAMAQAADFNGMQVHAIAGIGHPQRFFDQLRHLGIDADTHAFPDHHRYAPVDLEFGNADAILMTEKDAVKCAEFATEKYWVLRVDAQTDPLLFQHILKKIALYGHQTS